MYYSSHQYVSGMIVSKGLRYVDMFVYLYVELFSLCMFASNVQTYFKINSEIWMDIMLVIVTKIFFPLSVIDNPPK